MAGHPSGGAVDLTLIDAADRELPMGCNYDEDEEASDGACYSAYAGLLPTHAENRRLLFAVMASAGFINYPFEWWHWSYGDRYWAFITGQPAAIYAAVEDAELKACAHMSNFLA